MRTDTPPENRPANPKIRAKFYGAVAADTRHLFFLCCGRGISVKFTSA